MLRDIFLWRSSTLGVFYVCDTFMWYILTYIEGSLFYHKEYFVIRPTNLESTNKR